MIVCKQCGHQNESSEMFCGSCGAFLEFVGTKVPEAPTAVDLPPEPVIEARAGLIGRIRSGRDGDRDHHEPTRDGLPHGAVHPDEPADIDDPYGALGDDTGTTEPEPELVHDVQTTSAQVSELIVTVLPGPAMRGPFTIRSQPPPIAAPSPIPVSSDADVRGAPAKQPADPPVALDVPPKPIPPDPSQPDPSPPDPSPPDPSPRRDDEPRLVLDECLEHPDRLPARRRDDPRHVHAR